MADSLNARLASFFQARPGQWIDGKALGDIAGGYAWRSRVSDLRYQYGMTIENRQRRIRTEGRTFVVSEYRYVAREAVNQ